MSYPLSDIYKRSCKFGEYPDIWKLETVTPAPKKYPPQSPKDLEPIISQKSMKRNGVRKPIIPVLLNYFQNRQMRVKWHGLYSKIHSLPGGGPHGCYLGQLEYGSQSNDSGDCVSAEDKYKFVDDMSVLEWINLITC